MVWIWGNKSNHIFEIEATFLSNEADTISNFFEEKNNNIFITKHISKSFVLHIYLLMCILSKCSLGIHT